MHCTGTAGSWGVPAPCLRWQQLAWGSPPGSSCGSRPGVTLTRLLGRVQSMNQAGFLCCFPSQSLQANMYFCIRAAAALSASSQHSRSPAWPCSVLPLRVNKSHPCYVWEMKAEMSVRGQEWPWGAWDVLLSHVVKSGSRKYGSSAPNPGLKLGLRHLGGLSQPKRLRESQTRGL